MTVYTFKQCICLFCLHGMSSALSVPDCSTVLKKIMNGTLPHNHPKSLITLTLLSVCEQESLLIYLDKTSFSL